MSEKVKIGLLASHLEDIYTNEICRGAITGARDYGASLVIIPGRYLSPPHNVDNEDYLSATYPAIFNYAKNAGLSALIVSIGTIGSFVTMDEMERFLASFAPIPVVTLALKVGDRPCVYHDDSTGIREEVEHFINVHGKKRIGYITGPKGNVDAERRVEVYKQTLIENGLTFDPELVCYSNFCEYCRHSVEPFLNKCRADGVDSFCFANDAMASFVYDYARENHLSLGEDIFVAGYDNIYDCTSITPALSSVNADPAELGYRAVDMALRCAKNENVPDIILPTTFIFRDSCGCRLYNGIPENTGETPAEAAARVRDEIMGAFKDSSSFKKLSEDIYDYLYDLYVVSATEGNAGLHDPVRKHRLLDLLDRMVDVAGSVQRLPELVMKMYSPAIGFSPDQLGQINTYAAQGLAIWCVNLCLFKKSKYIANELSGISYFSNDVTFISGGKQGEPFYRAVIKKLRDSVIKAACLFTYETPLPAYSFDQWQKPDSLVLHAMFDDDRTLITENGSTIMTTDLFNLIPANGDALVVLPLLGDADHFGLMLCRVDAKGLSFAHNVAAHLSISVKIANLVAKLDSQVDELDKNARAMHQLSLTDDLTGLLNRRGFFETAGTIVHDQQFYGRKAVIVYGDLDGLKYINDNFGHIEGDAALRCAGKSLITAYPGRMVVASRVGGDEFAMMALLDEDMTPDSVLSTVKERLIEINADADKHYSVSMSLGVTEFICSSAISLPAIMAKADTNQYIEKEKSHARRGIKK